MISTGPAPWSEAAPGFSQENSLVCSLDYSALGSKSIGGTQTMDDPLNPLDSQNPFGGTDPIDDPLLDALEHSI